MTFGICRSPVDVIKPCERDLTIACALAEGLVELEPDGVAGVWEYARGIDALRYFGRGTIQVGLHLHWWFTFAIDRDSTFVILGDCLEGEIAA